MNISEAEKRALRELTEHIISSWMRFHEQFPNTLYHYTSAEGLIGISSTRSIWLTDLRYMNDSSELQYSKALVAERLDGKTRDSNLTDIQNEFLKRIRSSFDPFSYKFSVFSVSFCEDGNLLSQWRAYSGQGGGYAIGIDFFHTIRFLDKKCVLRRVIYDEIKQVNLIDDLIEKFLESIRNQTEDQLLEEVSSTLIPAYCQTFSSTIGEYLFCFKHPDFHEEKEWRLVYFSSIDPLFNRDKAIELPCFRSYHGNIIPYHQVSFDNAIKASCDDMYGIPFPIVEVIIGPTIIGELNQQSLSMILSSLNPDIAPNIKLSEIPLRWL